MLRTRALPLLATLVMAGCGVDSPFDRLFNNEDSSADSCEGIVCGACAPPLAVHVRGTPGEPPPQVTLVGVTGHCGDVGPSTMQCLPDVSGPGSYALEVQAPGYATAHVEATVPRVEVTGCCGCGYEPTRVDVVLTPSEG